MLLMPVRRKAGLIEIQLTPIESYTAAGVPVGAFGAGDEDCVEAHVALSTHHGIPSLEWSFANSYRDGHRPLCVNYLPCRSEYAPGDGVVRELHWHREADWAYRLEGSCRFTLLDGEGGAYEADLMKGMFGMRQKDVLILFRELGRADAKCSFSMTGASRRARPSCFQIGWLITPKKVVAKNLALTLGCSNRTSQKGDDQRQLS